MRLPAERRSAVKFAYLTLIGAITLAVQPTFTETGAVAGASAVANSSSSSSVDIDGDGLDDLVLIGSFGNTRTLVVYHNSGNGTFTDVTDSLPGLRPVRPANPLFASWEDFDNDGDPDTVLAVETPVSNELRFLENNRSGAGQQFFTEIQTIVSPSSNHFFSTPAWADFDNDGDLDIFVGRSGVPAPAMLLRNYLTESGTASFIDISSPTGILQQDVQSLRAHWADVDSDGDVDLFTVNGRASAILAGDIFYRNLLTETGIASLAEGNSFIFTAAGDHDYNYQGINESLDAIANSGSSFYLALGDFSYGQTSEDSWCSYVKSRVGATFPFELLSGDHEDGIHNPGDGLIENFAACLPDRLGASTGTYGKEYYFDYPSTNPLARLILISPGLDFASDNEGTYVYDIGTPRYNWVANAIDAARATGIRWVVVGMHRNCISTGYKACDIGPDILNLLLQKKVDLILQANDHTYQRSKQLSLSTSCTGIVPNAYNSACVADDGSDDLYQKGAGSVLVIGGTASVTLDRIKNGRSDPENDYFARWMGSNLNPTTGILKFTVGDSQLSAEFVPAYGGNFVDSFIIADSGTNTAPTVTISSPTDGSSFIEGDGITFIGSATDAEDGDVTSGISWHSNLDGSIGTGGSLTTTLSVGTHTITASVSDSGGLSVSDTIIVTVTSSSGITLSAMGYKIRGLQKADLSWTSPTAVIVDVFRNGNPMPIATGISATFYTDNIDNKGGGSYSYQVCEAGTANCSNVATVAF